MQQRLLALRQCWQDDGSSHCGVLTTAPCALATTVMAFLKWPSIDETCCWPAAMQLSPTLVMCATQPGEGEISWWASNVAVCSVDSHTLQPLACEDYDPRTWQECLWNKGFEGTGVEDPRLIVWPGKGLFMMFGSKPWPLNPKGIQPADTTCDGPWAFQQWMILLQPYGPTKDAKDPWQNGIIRMQYLPKAPSDPSVLIKEKNWNPFVYKGKLYFSQVRRL